MSVVENPSMATAELGSAPDGLAKAGDLLPIAVTAPTEVWHAIFDQMEDESGGTGMTLSEFFRMGMICQRLRHITSSYKKVFCTFKVDEPSHSAWKLFRLIVLRDRDLDRDIGQHIGTIRVKWQRRNPAFRDTWTRPWVWSAEEKRRLLAIEDSLHLDPFLATMYAITVGVNSEALIPALLFHTPNLKVLDLGTVPVGAQLYQYISYGPIVRDLADRLKRLGNLLRPENLNNDTAWNLGPENLENSASAGNDSLPDSDKPNHNLPPSVPLLEPSYHEPQLWTQFNASPRIPGLANITSFEYKTESGAQIGNRAHPVLLLPFLLLPHIEIFDVSGISGFKEGVYRSIRSALNKWNGRKSTVRKLAIQESILDEDDWIALAGVTQTLDSATISITTRESLLLYPYPEDKETDKDAVETAFLQNNSETLQKSEFKIVA
ncbi:hypothetical protein ABW21_db0200227 [Orbilia brochopaga]|nr:hypothetical protein ABW21_db0200227 [Drechslerella brochopaga]